jgi:hypothetical protein
VATIRELHDKVIASLTNGDIWFKTHINRKLWLVVRCARRRMPGKHFGYCDSVNRVIWIASHLSSAEQVEIVAHEVYHSVSGDYEELKADPIGRSVKSICSKLDLLK